MTVPITDDRIRRWESIYQACASGASKPIADLWDVIVRDFRARSPAEQEEILALVHVPALRLFFENIRKGQGGVWSGTTRVDNPSSSISTKILDPSLSQPQHREQAGIPVRPVRM